MTEAVENLLISSGSFAIFVSIAINIVISVAGIIQSVFITAANIAFFEFNIGLVIFLSLVNVLVQVSAFGCIEKE